MKQIVINQHYIPKSYLKNFGFLVNAKKKKWSLYAMENGGEIERRTTSNICTVDYLYDLPLLEGEERQFIEHAYDKEVDRYFTEITEYCKNESNVTLSQGMREKIVKSCLSLYYRTPKFVELDETAWDEIQKSSKEEQEEEWKWRKTQMLIEHLENFESLFKDKLNCGISVNKVESKWELISSDNPVVIRKGAEELVNVLSPENITHIPLTPNLGISIMPSFNTDLFDTFQRYSWDDDSVMINNYTMETMHQRFLIGTQKALQTYLDESPFYKEPFQLDHPKILNLHEKAAALAYLSQILESNGGQITHEYKNAFYNFWKNIEAFRLDPNSKRHKRELDGM